MAFITGILIQPAITHHLRLDLAHLSPLETIWSGEIYTTVVNCRDACYCLCQTPLTSSSEFCVPTPFALYVAMRSLTSLEFEQMVIFLGRLSRELPCLPATPPPALSVWCEWGSFTMWIVQWMRKEMSWSWGWLRKLNRRQAGGEEVKWWAEWCQTACCLSACVTDIHPTSTTASTHRLECRLQSSLRAIPCSSSIR